MVNRINFPQCTMRDRLRRVVNQAIHIRAYALVYFRIDMRVDTTKKVCVTAALTTAALLVAPSAAVAETRGYIISWFATATYNKEFKATCPLDKNGGQVKLNTRQLMEIGYSEAEAIKIVENSGAQLSPEYVKRIVTNAKVNG